MLFRLRNPYSGPGSVSDVGNRGKGNITIHTQAILLSTILKLSKMRVIKSGVILLLATSAIAITLPASEGINGDKSLSNVSYFLYFSKIKMPSN
jgi:hypothetical protein